MDDERPKLDIDKLISDEQERQRQWNDVKKKYEGHTFKDYLKLLEEDRKIAQNAQARILEMVLTEGTEKIPEDERAILLFGDEEEEKSAAVGYGFFRKNLFGIDRSLRDVVKHVEAGAHNLSTGKKLLLLVGPPSSGKSTIVLMIKNGLERYSLRPLFRVAGCPINEEPLRLIPPQSDDREKIGKTLGIKIDGNLCPRCYDRVKNQHNNAWWDAPVEVFAFSSQDRRGISAWEPSDAITETVTGLVGGEQVAISGNKGVDHPEAVAYWMGAVPMANRGIFEGVEILRADPKTMRVFFSACEEKRVKSPDSPFYISVDELLVGHTNLVKYKEYKANKENEGLLERMFPVFVPYTLRIKDEVRIYKKLIETETDFLTLHRCHIAPGSLELAALFAVMTRLNESDSGISILTKAKAYNGDLALTELVDSDKKIVDVQRLVEEGQEDQDGDIAKCEGMHGLGSRDVLTAINKALVELGELDGCLTPTKIIRALSKMFSYLMRVSPEEIENYREGLLLAESDSVVTEYKDFVTKVVSGAFLRANEDVAQDLFRRYIEEVKFDRSRKRKFVLGIGSALKRDFSGKKRDPDERFMRSIEECGDITEDAKDGFRGEIIESMGEQEDLSYKNYKPLAEMINRRLLADSRALLVAVLSKDKPKNEEAKTRAQNLFQGLLDNNFCKICAREAIERAGEFLSE